MNAPAQSAKLPQPFTILIGALGGEGGGVLASWLVEAAARSGFPAQSTSIPGVSQRTGATTYYVEIFPVRQETLAGQRPVMSLVPSPGAIDMLAATELVEAGRAMQNGFVTARRTTLIASTHRIYATSEKTVPSDGRYASGKILAAAVKLARRAILFDMDCPAREVGSVINSVVFGAMAGSGALPLSRDACEAAIHGAGRSAAASLRGFAFGYAHAAGATARPTEAPIKPPLSSAPACEWVVREFPSVLHDLLNRAVVRLGDYQDDDYADEYLTRLRPVLDMDCELAGDVQDFALTRETARHLALWMTYEDVIRVADLKTRARRFAFLRKEAGAQASQPLVIVDYLKPGIEEIADVLPLRLAGWLRRWERRRRAHGRSVGFSLRLRTSTLCGFLALRLLALLKPLRRHSSRFAGEQVVLRRWLEAIERHGRASLDRELALEIVQCAALLRGYGETQRRGKEAFEKIFDGLLAKETVAPGGSADLKSRLRKARNAALADPDAPAGKPVFWLKAGGAG